MGMLRPSIRTRTITTAKSLTSLKTDQRSEYFGIGASIQNYSIGDQGDTYITATFQNSPAARAGLRFGDRIIAVDGVKMAASRRWKCATRFADPRGSVVKVTLERAC